MWPSNGAGDIGGRTDIRDAIYDDYLAEDYYFSQAGVDSILHSWIPGSSVLPDPRKEAVERAVRTELFRAEARRRGLSLAKVCWE